MKRSALVILVAVAFLPACESTDVGPATTSMALADDERRLWARTREEESTLDNSGFELNSPAIEAYLDGIVARLHPQPLVEGTRLHVKVLVDPSFNAFALPTGTIYIHTGLLARIENEAQLAAVLGHELTHSTNRHALKSYRTLKNESAFLATLTVGTGGIGGLLGGLGAMASISGYSRDLEREADENGFKLMVAAGYDPRESVKVFQLLLTESKRSKIKEPYFFGSHPRLEERIANFQELLDGLAVDKRNGRTGADDYAAMLPPILIANARAALDAGDFDFANECAEHDLRLHPGDRQATFLLAEVHRQRGAKGDVDEALRLYRALADQYPEFAEAHRGLGLVLMKNGDKTRAAAAFRRYLALKASPEDRAYIEGFLQQCEPKS